MCPRTAHPPSRAAEGLKKYLDIFDIAHAKRDNTLRYDVYRRGGAQAFLFSPKPPESFFSVPNFITMIRLGGSIVYFSLAIIEMNALYNYIGLIVHSIGDVLDGFYARFFKQETILGAKIDIIADRIEFTLFYLIHLIYNPDLFHPIMAYLISFSFVDFFLSYQFIKFDIISINYFDKVDKVVYRLNFSPLGKICNTVPVTLLLIFVPQAKYIIVMMTVCLICVKAYSISRLRTRAREKESES